MRLVLLSLLALFALIVAVVVFGRALFQGVSY
jgi:hypothetical protein